MKEVSDVFDMYCISASAVERVSLTLLVSILPEFVRDLEPCCSLYKKLTFGIYLNIFKVTFGSDNELSKLLVDFSFAFNIMMSIFSTCFHWLGQSNIIESVEFFRHKHS